MLDMYAIKNDQYCFAETVNTQMNLNDNFEPRVELKFKYRA